MVPMLVWRPCWVWGMSSSVTTYIMAPAAKARTTGRSGVTSPVMATMIAAPAGSTAPHSVPARNARGRERPLVAKGSDTMAPSGTF